MTPEQAKRIIKEVHDFLDVLAEIEKQAIQDHGAAAARLERLEKRIEKTLGELIGQDEADNFKNRPLITYQMDEPVQNVLKDAKDVRDYLGAVGDEWQHKSETQQVEDAMATAVRTLSAEASIKENPRMVFMVFGRNRRAKNIMQEFLEEIGLEPYDLVQIEEKTTEATALIRDLLDQAFKISHAVIVLLTPDDDSQLRDEWVEDVDRSEGLQKLMPQPRMNVIFEIGIAWGLQNWENTLLVQMYKPADDVQFRLPSDINGHLLARIIPGTDIVGELRKIVGKFKRLKCPAELPDPEILEDYANRLSDAIANPKPIDIPESWAGRTVLSTTQGQVFLPIDLHGKKFRSASFKVRSESTYWRAGIIFESKDASITVPDLVHRDSLLFHVSRTYDVYGSTAYLNVQRGEPPTADKRGLVFDDGILIQLTLREMNVLECKAGMVDWPLNLNDLRLDRIYLAAWGDRDENNQLRDFKVEFLDIQVKYD